MATAVITDTYLQQMHTARTQLILCFRRAHELLTVRETILLRELEDIQNDYKTRYNSSIVEIQKLEVSKQTEQNNEKIESINCRIQQLQNISSGTTIKFQWNADFDKDLQHAGEIVTTSPQPAQHFNPTPAIPQPANMIPVIPQHATRNYENNHIPVITCCRHREGKSIAPGQFYNPNGLAIEPLSGRIYIADTGNDRVQVFNPNGEYSFMFSRNMNGPYSVCIYFATVCVSQSGGNCIILYTLDGKYVNKFGTDGTKDGQLKDPRGIAISPITSHLYVCDWGNHRVQLFDEDLKFHAIFNNNVIHPLDIKLTDELVFVLDVGNLCVNIFSIIDHSLFNSIISYGIGKQIRNPLFFTINAEQHLLLTDYALHCVMIFSMSGEFITNIGKKGHAAGEFMYPTGIAIDEQNRIVVMSKNHNTSLQIF